MKNTQKILPEVFTAKENTTVSKPDFLCIKMPLHLSILLQLIELISTI